MVEAGRITLVGGRVNPEVADIQLEGNTDQTKPRNSVSGNPKGAQNGAAGTLDEASRRALSASRKLQDHRARIAALDVEEREIDLAMRRGETVKKVDVRRELFELARLARDRVMGVPAKIAVEVAAEADPAVVRARMEDALRVALETLGGEQ